MKYLSPMDAAFLRMESPNTPMHVGALLTFNLPDDAPPDFLRKLIRTMGERPFMPPPFSCKLVNSKLSRIAPAWEETTVDMDYHLRLSALPYPGGERELGKLIERLHSRPLDFARPLWECTLVEGLENRRFALYFKAHHCAIDGMGAMRMVQNWLSLDPDDRSMERWVVAIPPSVSGEAGEVDKSVLSRLKRPAKAAVEQARGLRELTGMLRKMGKGEDSGTRGSLETPRSLFNVGISKQRRLGTQILDLRRIKAIGATTGTTVNDVLLAVCGGAMRRYLLENSALPKKSLIASVPIGLPRPDGQPGNAVAGFVTPVGTDYNDPLKRLTKIHRVTERSKRELLSMSRTALSQLAMLGLSPLLIGQMTGTLAKLPPIFNVTVSNVVLSKNPLYLMGAKLEAMYPVSFLLDGYVLNITLVGYADRVAVGFLGCRDAIPRLQRLAVYTGEALAELENAVNNRSAPKPPRKRKVAAVRR